MERRQLPMWGARESFLKEVRKHPTVVLLAETGSGKTTLPDMQSRQASWRW